MDLDVTRLLGIFIGINGNENDLLLSTEDSGKDSATPSKMPDYFQ